MKIQDKFNLLLAKGDKVTAKKLKHKIKAKETLLMYKKIAN